MLNVIDIGIVLVLVMAFIVGAKRGVIKEAVSLIGIIVVFALSFALRAKVGNILCIFLPFVKFSGNMKEMTTMNIFLYQALAFGLIFGLLMGVYAILLKLSGILQKIVNFTIILWLPSAILGGLVSLIKNYVIIFAAILILMIPLGENKLFAESKLVNFMLNKTPIVSAYSKNYVKPIEEIYSLGVKLAKEEITIYEADLESIDIMLRYNVITKDEIEKLIKLKKIDRLDELDAILEKY